MSNTGKMYATVSLKVNIFNMFSKSNMKCSLSLSEYLEDLGSPSLINPWIKDYLGVIYSPSKSSDSSSSEGESDSSSMPSPSLFLSPTLLPPRSSLALATSSFFLSSSSALSKCFYIKASMSSSLPSRDSTALSCKSVEPSNSSSSSLISSFLPSLAWSWDYLASLWANMLPLNELSCKFVLDELLLYFETTTFELELNLVYWSMGLACFE